MERYDVAVIGGGIIGCAILRELTKLNLSCVLLEAKPDVGAGTTKANGGLIHSGYDPTPGTVKSQVNALGNRLYPQLARELGFSFRQTGSMVLGFSEQDLVHLRKLAANGLANGVEGLQIVGQERIHELEPQASTEATCALWCPHTGFVDPFEVTEALAENAVHNGAVVHLDAPVVDVAREEGGFEVLTPNETVQATWLVNAAGAHADDVARMAGDNTLRIAWRQGNLLVLDKNCGVHDIMPLYPVPTPTTKGVVVIGTVHGNVIIGSTAVMRNKDDCDCYAADINELLAGARKLAPALDPRKVIREFAGGRAVMADTNDFHISASSTVPGLVNVAGIQSPGVASAPAIARRVVAIMGGLGMSLAPRPGFDPIREPPADFDVSSLEEQQRLIQKDCRFGHIVCRCETVTEAEIVEAIHRTPPATTVEAVKRRTRAGMGRCQSGFCQSRVVEILARELGIRPDEVRLEGDDSQIVYGPVKGAR